MKYYAINLGPIFKTLEMARKPRQLWAASYMFSYLMECIFMKLPDSKNITVLSPYYNAELCKVSQAGLLPDRMFCRADEHNGLKDDWIEDAIDNAITHFATTTGIEKQILEDFFNIMILCDTYDSDAEAIAGLNKSFDYMELSQNAWQRQEPEHIREKLLPIKDESLLFKIKFGDSKHSIPSLEEIAKWSLNANEKMMSYHNYVCVVQADGDSMGSIVSSTKMEGKLTEFSEKLVTFGNEACETIKKYGGLPIYAGGDDLLFIAPVYGDSIDESPICKDNGHNILDLIAAIDKKYGEIKKTVDELEAHDKDGKRLSTSMSYGIAIMYYKYPLYEAWKMANHLLFYKAKKLVPDKNAIAITLRKHSGSDYSVLLSKSANGGSVYSEFQDLIKQETRETIVSAVAHKLHENESLISAFTEGEVAVGQFSKRMDAFYDRIIDVETKDENETTYLDTTKKIFIDMCKDRFSDKECSGMKSIISDIYGLLRIAKFLNGEDVKDGE